MNQITVYHYDAFTETPNKGNPAGVVIDADHLTDNQMQEIAYQVGFNETAFVFKSDQADLRIRYFSPGLEMNLCGHATIAALYCLATRGLINKSENFTIETKAGVLRIGFLEKNNRLYLLMDHAKPEFKPFVGSTDTLAEAMGMKPNDIDSDMPIVYGSTGSWTLLVPIKTLEAFSRMKPQNSLFPTILTKIPRCSIHPFCLETTKKTVYMHARHFSSPFTGTTEDPVTGTASGVMGAYSMTYLSPDKNDLDLVIEQGLEIGRAGEVCVTVKRRNGELSVTISGTAVYSNEFMIAYE